MDGVWDGVEDMGTQVAQLPFVPVSSSVRALSLTFVPED